MSTHGFIEQLHPTLLAQAMKAKGYPITLREWDLNLVGVRNADRDSNDWNDALAVMWQANGHINTVTMRCTTDPGHYWREHPMNPKGTAQLKPGHYPDLWQLGLHRGRYEALVQRGPCTVYRDNDGDTQLDEQQLDRGLFGINLHRAADSYDAPESVGRWSAGCQVVPDTGDYTVLMALCKQQARYHGNQFHYTLIEEQDLWTQ
jgi:hypothetical protein